ncbi:MAG: hypothetical protein ACTHYY_10455, partial [Agrococcus casei]
MLQLTPQNTRRLVRAARRHGMSIATLAEAAATSFGDSTALVTATKRYSFRELWNTAESLAAGLYLHVLGRQPRMIVV